MNSSYNDPNSNATIDFFQLNITSFQAQIYPNLAKTSLVGYNGMSPGPTFRVQRGVQSVVRVVNQNGKRSSNYARPSLIIHFNRSTGCIASSWIILSRCLGWLGWRFDPTGPVQRLLFPKLKYRQNSLVPRCAFFTLDPAWKILTWRRSREYDHLGQLI